MRDLLTAPLFFKSADGLERIFARLVGIFESGPVAQTSRETFSFVKDLAPEIYQTLDAEDISETDLERVLEEEVKKVCRTRKSTVSRSRPPLNDFNRQFLSPFFPRRIGINFTITDRCNIACDLCAPGCSPTRRGFLTANQMLGIYTQVSSFAKIDQIVFTGGEPTLYLKEIIGFCEGIRDEAKKSLIRIVTNGAFARTSPQATRIVQKMKDIGVSEIAFSTDDFHEELLDKNLLDNLVQACEIVDLTLNISHKSFPGSRSSKEVYERRLNRRLHSYWGRRLGQHDDLITFSTGPTLPIGRGAELYDWAVMRSLNWLGPCSEMAKRTTVAPSGRAMPCCGLVDRSLSEFSGNISKFDGMNYRQQVELIDESILCNWLALEGPSSIHASVVNATPPKLVGQCEACQLLFSNIETRRKIAGVLPKQASRLRLRRLFYEVSQYFYRVSSSDWLTDGR